MSHETLSPSRARERVALDSGRLDDSGSVSLLDDPLEWGSFGRPAAASHDRAQTEVVDPLQVPLWESHVVLDGMHCATCALTIEAALNAVPGVQRADVSGATHRAKVQWDPEQVRPSQWMAAIQQVGYGVLPARDAHARELRQAENRRALWRWLVAGFCMMQVMMYAWPAYEARPGDLTQEMETLLRWASWVISIPVILFACGPFFRSAWRDLRTRSISMDLPVAVGMLITFVVSSMGTFDPDGPFGKEVFYDSLTMFAFFLLSGRWLELRLRDKTAGALEAVMNRLPDSVERRLAEGGWERVAVRRLQAGDVVRVLAGEAFPADGVVVQGQTHADEALLTGESTPVRKAEGDAVTAGSYNLGNPVEVAVDVVGGQTRFAQIVDLMESAALQKPRLAQLADRVAKPFLLVVMLAALAAGLYWWPSNPSHAMMVAVAILIVTCPCALSLATPVAMLSAAGSMARQGVLVRNLQALESLAEADTLVFDKTGTLTQDGMQIMGVDLAPGSPAASADAALALAGLLGGQSAHPVSRALALAAQGLAAPAVAWQLQSVEETAGAGLRAQLLDAQGAVHVLRLGSWRFAGQDQAVDGLQRVYLAEETEAGLLPWASVRLSEGLRPEARAVVAALGQAGMTLHLLSGDRDAAVQHMAQAAGIAHARSECTPQDKLEALQALQAQGRRVAMVGDGLNDGPVLAGAHVSFAFGRAVPLAQSRSDFVVLGDDLGLIAQSVLLARKTMRIVRQNLAWAAAYNAVSIPLAVMGWMPAWLAGLGMALSSLLVVLNAARLAKPLPVAAGQQGQGGAAVRQGDDAAGAAPLLGVR
ncbi:heavy metal translocating P-type ATPase [Comamonas sp. GB3 AK4-5]|uniref:heavy metal translocating P-type ATPase n=1 Tax=Comamonas sp. GB3 AK4-5 TaxID=3231487 RepID=UPI00351F5E55